MSGSMSAPCGVDTIRVECCRLLEKHPSMIPGHTWGDMDGADREYWKEHNCDAKVGGSSKSKCPCPGMIFIVQFIINRSKINTTFKLLNIQLESIKALLHFRFFC